MHRAVLALLLSLLTAWAASAEQFDLVLKGGRVVDPETGLDAVRDVGLRGDRVARISPNLLMEPVSWMFGGWWSPPASSTFTRMDRTPSLPAQGAGRRDDRARDGDRRPRLPRVPARAGGPRADPLRRDREPGGRAGGRLRPAAGAGAIVPPWARTAPATADQVDGSSHLRAGSTPARSASAWGWSTRPAQRRLEVIEFSARRGRGCRSTSHPERRADRAGLERRVGRRGDRGQRRHRRPAAHRPHQLSSCRGRARVPADDRGRPGARARRDDRGLSVRRRHDGSTRRSSTPAGGKLGIDYERDIEMPETGERLTGEPSTRYHAQPEPQLVLIHTNTDRWSTR